MSDMRSAPSCRVLDHTLSKAGEGIVRILLLVSASDGVRRWAGSARPAHRTPGARTRPARAAAVPDPRPGPVPRPAVPA
ncbi:hypothetical protein Ate01nite_24430 [Actinoplanes teichomyceticus]|nr:hypothetical protein Ate01nite_24430 [Actinoplanes teichomyceticus]